MLLITLLSLNFHIPVIAADEIARVLALLPKVATNHGEYVQRAPERAKYPRLFILCGSIDFLLKMEPLRLA